MTITNDFNVFQGMKLLYHKIVAKSLPELEPYSLNIVDGRYAFGWTQSQVFPKSEVYNLLKDILINARDKFSNHIIVGNQIENIMRNIAQEVEEADKPLENTILEQINKALSSDYGRYAIDTRHKEKINKFAKKVDNMISSIKHLGAKEFYNTELGKLLFASHVLQNKQQNNTSFLKFLDGEEIQVKVDKKVVSLQLNDIVTLQDHVNYVLNQDAANEDQYRIAKEELINAIEVYNQYSSEHNIIYALTFNKVNRDAEVIPITKPQGQEVMSSIDKLSNKIILQVGNPKDNSIKTTCEKFSLTTSLSLNPDKIVYMKIGANFDDYAMITLNNHLIDHSVKDGNILEPVLIDGVYKVLVKEQEQLLYPCNTDKNWKFDMMEVTEYLQNGNNTIVMDFVVGGYGEGVINIELLPLQYLEEEMTIKDEL